MNFNYLQCDNPVIASDLGIAGDDKSVKSTCNGSMVMTTEVSLDREYVCDFGDNEEGKEAR